jgi:hypothetical protein
MRPHAPMRPPFLDEQDAAEKIGLHVEPLETVHVARRIDAAKMHCVHDASLDKSDCRAAAREAEFPRETNRNHFGREFSFKSITRSQVLRGTSCGPPRSATTGTNY